MIKIGITGQDGFIGQHLYNELGILSNTFERIDFKKDFFKDAGKLAEFVAKCDVIIHLAALNRHADPNMIYHTNVNLVEQLVTALEVTNSKAHVLFSSSLQEEKDNLYGKSKKKGRDILIDWAKKSGGRFTGFIIPNVFGPFGRPFYNSFIATFSHQLCNDDKPRIESDSKVKLIYISDLVKILIREISSGVDNYHYEIPQTDEYQVSEILTLLTGYQKAYLFSGIIPELKSPFEVNLFNTFRSYIDIRNRFPVKYVQNSDPRGTFVEIIRLNVGGQVSFSTTLPEITRGNHYHTRKIERFSVIKGEARIQLRRVGATETLDFYLSGSDPAYVDMPIWYTHNIKNVGSDELYTLFWINEFYDPNDPDTYFENVSITPN